MATINTSITGPFVLSGTNNPLTITGTGTVTATASGADAIDAGTGATWNLINSGTATSATGSGVSFGSQGTITNNGLISGARAIRFTGGAGTVVNAATITGNGGDIISMFAGGLVSNASGGTISSQALTGASVYLTGAPSTVTNAGRITGIDYAVFLGAGGTVANSAGGYISGRRGVNMIGGTGVVTNSGGIIGTTSFGVRLNTGGQVTNTAGGSISGATGVQIYAAAGTITNNGTITGTTHAIQMTGTGANRVAVGAESVITGDVVGSAAAGAANTLELLGGTGTISGLLAGDGTVTENAKTWTFKNFTSLAVDAGASWTLTGKNTIASLLDNGTLTIAAGGSLTVTTAFDPSSMGVINISDTAVLDFAADVGAGARISFLSPTGTLELADIVGGVVRQFNGTISGLTAGTSTTVPTNAINIQTTVTGATLTANTITVMNGTTTVATLLLATAPAPGVTVVTKANATLGGSDVFLTSNATSPPVITWPPASGPGVEGTAISPGMISPAGTGLISVIVSGIPVGDTLSDGTKSFTAQAGAISVNVLGWNYGSLTITTVNNANFTLSAWATDSSGNVSAVVNEAITVIPLAPTVSPVTVSGSVGQAIALNPGISVNGLAGDSNSLSTVTISNIPAGAALSNTFGDTLTISGGVITFSAAQLAAGVLTGLKLTLAAAGTFVLTIAAAEQDAQNDVSSIITNTETVTATAGGTTISTSITGPYTLNGTASPLTITGTGAVVSTAANTDAITGESAGAWAVTNGGTIKATSGSGILLRSGGTIANGGLINGARAIRISGAAGSVTNAGTIIGTQNDVISLFAGGAVSNAAAGTITSQATAGASLYITGASGTVINAGVLSGIDIAAFLGAGGTIVNGPGGSITGARGVRIKGSVGTVTNSGTILATTSDVISLLAGGAVANATGATIAGLGPAGVSVYINGGAGSVTNSGTIAGIDYGVDLRLGGTVANNSGGLITGQRGVDVKGSAGTISNSGGITGSTSVGARLQAGGTITNTTSGSISGPLGAAIYGTSGGTVVNYGHITGTRHAVQFLSSGANRLVVGASAVFTGDVAGSALAGSTNTLELAGGTASLSGLAPSAEGTMTLAGKSWVVTNFTTLAVDAGASLSLNGGNTVAAIVDNGVINLAGALTVTGAIDAASTGLIQIGGNSLKAAAATGATTRIGFLGASQLLIDDSALFGVNVGTASYTGPVLESFGADDKIDLRGFSLSGIALDYTPGTGVLRISNSASRVASLAFQTSSLASSSFQAVTDSSGGTFIQLGSVSPIVTISLSNDTGTSNADRLTSIPSVSGLGAANAVVNFTIDGNPLAAAVTAGAGGVWSFTPAGLTNGTHTIVASESIGSASLTFTMDAAPPPVTATLANDTGAAGDRITAETALTGFGDANAIVTLTEGGTVLGAAAANAAGIWTFAPAGLNEGTHTIVASETDAAGNTGTASLTFTQQKGGSFTPVMYDHIVVVVEENRDARQIIGDTVNAPYINQLAGSGLLLTNYTAVTHPSQPNYFALYGGSTFGATADVRYTLTGPTLGTMLQSSGKSFVGYVEQPNSAFNHNPWESFPEGFSVEQNFTSFPASNNFAALPTVSFVIPGLDHDMHNGTVAQGDAWLNSNISSYAQWATTNNSLLVVVWDENDGRGGNQVAAILQGANVAAATSNTAYNHYNLLSTILAASGLPGLNNSTTATPINVGPAAATPVVTLGLVQDTGAQGSDKVTANGALSGIADTNAFVTLKEGALTLGTVQTNSAGKWTFTPSGLAEGTHTIVASETNSLGLSGSASLTFTLDTIAPITVVSLTSDTGVLGDSVTSNPALTGSGDANATITIKEGTTLLGSATANAKGEWTFSPSGLSQGAHTIVVSETDTAGNTGSATLTFTLDSTPPAVTVGLANDTGTPGDKITSDPALIGTGDANAIVTLKEGANTLGTAAADAAGVWTFTPVGLSLGLHTIVASETDIAGNTGTAPLTFTLGGATISTNITGPITMTGALNPLTITPTETVTSTGAKINGINGAAGTTWNITNNGTIKAAGAGVSLAGAGVVSSTGVVNGISGFVLRGGGTVSNSGSISGSGAIGSGSGNGSGIFMTGAVGTVTNSGTINGGAYGVALDAGGQVTNTNTIIGGEDGVRIFGARGSVTNSGLIMSTVDDGIGFFGGGIVTNEAGGTIGNLGTKGAGIYITGGTVSGVTNAGTIGGIDFGVFLGKGGTVDNAATGTISSHRGARIQGGAATLTNSGMITGTTSYGVHLLAGGQITNMAGGAISGTTAILAAGTAATITNNGGITGSTHAISFTGTGANRLAIGASSTITGDVLGSTASGAANTLELAGGTGTISGLTGGAGSVTENGQTWTFKNFNSVVADTGANWSLNGKNTIATIVDHGSLTIANGGGLTVTSAIDAASSGVFLIGAGSTLKVAAALGLSTKISFMTSSTLIIDNAALFGTNAGQASYAGPLLQSFVAGDTIDIKGFAATNISSAFDINSGILQISNATSKASLAFQTAGLGSGNFNIVTDGGTGIFVTHS